MTGFRNAEHRPGSGMQGFAGLSLFAVLPADGPGAGHHLRPDGRDQHGPRRVHDHRRLHHLPGASTLVGPLFQPGLYMPLLLSVAISRGGLRHRLRGPGWLVEWGLIRHLYKRPLDTLLATWGISLILQQAYRSIFGAARSRRRTAAVDAGLAARSPTASKCRSTASS